MTAMLRTHFARYVRRDGLGMWHIAHVRDFRYGLVTRMALCGLRARHSPWDDWPVIATWTLLEEDGRPVCRCCTRIARAVHVLDEVTP